MISHADVEKLRSMRAPGPTVLSLYLPVPLDPAGVQGLAAQAGDLMAGAGSGRPDSASIAKVGHADFENLPRLRRLVFIGDERLPGMLKFHDLFDLAACSGGYPRGLGEHLDLAVCVDP